jgi:enamine deaminase RidA (YjgF/YER057c/UK114 family)
MADTTTEQARAKGVIIPAPPATGSYHVAVVQTGNLLFHSGQTPIVNGEKVLLGMVGRDLTPEQAEEAARIAAMNMIAQISAFLDGNLDRVRRCVRLTGYVNSAPDFFDQPQVIHGASKAVIDVFGEERGLHARAVFGMTPMPFNVSVVIDGVWEVR